MARLPRWSPRRSASWQPSGLFRWFVDRQRLVNSFLTNVRGPQEHVTFSGARVTQIVPITITAGNVTVAFAILSYAGTLTTTVIVDPDAVPDIDVLTSALRSEIRALTEPAASNALPSGADSGHD